MCFLLWLPGRGSPRPSKPHGPGTDPPPPTARTLKADNEVMEKFDRALQTLPVDVRLFFDPTQVAGDRLHTPRPCCHPACGSPVRQP